LESNFIGPVARVCGGKSGSVSTCSIFKLLRSCVCAENHVQSPLRQSSPASKQSMPSPTRTAAVESTVQPVLRASDASKEDEDDDGEEEDSESGDSETESEESSAEEESSTPFVEYDAEPLAKSRTQSRSMVRSVADTSDVQPTTRKSIPKSPPSSESKLPVPDGSSVALVSPVGRVSQSSLGFPSSANMESGYTGKSPRSSVGVVPVSPVGRASQPSPVLIAEPAYAGKIQTSPAIHSPVLSNEPNYAGKTQASPTVRSPMGYFEPGDALKFQRSPVEPAPAGKPRRLPSNSAGMPEQVEYAQFDSEPMLRNPQRRSIPYADDGANDNRFSPAAPIPSSPRKPSSPQVQASTLVAPAVPVVITQTGFVQTFEAPSVSVPRATAGPILMPPAPPELTARVRASPVLRLVQNPTPGSSSQDSLESRGRVRPPSNPPAAVPRPETAGDAVSELFTKLETTGYSNPPSQIPPVRSQDQMVRSQEASYGPGYRPSAHGAIVRPQEPYPVEVMVYFVAFFYFLLSCLPSSLSFFFYVVVFLLLSSFLFPNFFSRLLLYCIVCLSLSLCHSVCLPLCVCFFLSTFVNVFVCLMVCYCCAAADIKALFLIDFVSVDCGNS